MQNETGGNFLAVEECLGQGVSVVRPSSIREMSVIKGCHVF